MPILLLLLLLFPPSASAEPLDELSAKPFDSASTSNPFGASSPFSNQFTTNPYATDAPRLYDQQRNYRGKLSANPYDPDSMRNPYGCYGSLYSSESLNNQSPRASGDRKNGASRSGKIIFSREE